jgi:NADPH:quinone reductase-like Zn-dependent oxidoreductase
MKAILYERYGSPEQLVVREIEKPVPTDDQVLVKVHAVSVNASDMEFLTANPGYVRIWGPLKPKHQILGTDIAGVVEAVGKNVSGFKSGDAVYGDNLMNFGGFAEYVCVPPKMLLPKPDGLSFEQVSTLPQAGIVALQGLRDKGKLRAGESVLIVGSGGGSGSFAIQIAKNMGARVTGVDNGEKLDFMRELGADQVIDYTQQDYTELAERYDLILDFVAPHSIFANKHVLNPGGRYVLVGGRNARIYSAALLGPIVSKFGNKSLGMLFYQQNKRPDLETLVQWCEAGSLTPAIEKIYPLEQTADALQYLIDRHVKGKLVIKII